MPFEVAKATVLVTAFGYDKVTGNRALVSPAFPSITVASPIASEPTPTAVTATATLLDGSASTSPRDTLIMLLMLCPPLSVRTTIVAVAAARFVSKPRAHTTVPPFVTHVPWLAAADTSCTSEESTFVSTTPVASDGPELSTLIESVRLLPTPTGSGPSATLTTRSLLAYTLIGFALPLWPSESAARSTTPLPASSAVTLPVHTPFTKVSELVGTIAIGVPTLTWYRRSTSHHRAPSSLLSKNASPEA